MKEEDKLNDWALETTGADIHISQAISGKRGYFCPACKLELVAKKGSFLVHHFAHDAKDALIKGKCTYSNETERHRVAKNILQMLGQIKVPPLVKYPPVGSSGNPYKLKESHFIKASRIEIELSFYEDENGLIRWGREFINKDDSKRHLYFTPDVAFFDSDNKPILLIELVATHKPDRKKIEKLINLGIDTVQVMIPKGSQIDIEKTFKVTEHTKWLYNYEREQTTYSVLLGRANAQVSDLDKFDRVVFEAVESFECKKNRINNFYRALTKFVGTEQFRKTKQYIDGEIRRVKENTERERYELERLQRELCERTDDRLGAEFQKVVDEQGKIRNRYYELEGRYFDKVSEIEAEERDYRAGVQPEIDRITKLLAELGVKPGAYEEEMERIRTATEQSHRSTREEERNLDTLIENFDREKDEIERRTDLLPEEYRNIEARIRAEFENRRRELGENFRKRNRDAVEKIERRNSEGASKLERRIKDILSDWEHVCVIEAEKALLRRIERATKFFDTKAFKNWV